MSQNTYSIPETGEKLLKAEEKQEASELQEQEESKPHDQEASKPQEQETSEPQEREASEPQEQEASKLQEQETSKPQEQEVSKPQEQQVPPTYFSNLINFWKSYSSSKTSNLTPEPQEELQSAEDREEDIEMEIPTVIVPLPSLRTLTNQFSDALHRQANTLSEKASVIQDREVRKGLFDIADSIREVSTSLRSFNDNNILSMRYFRAIFSDPVDENADDIDAKVFKNVIGEMAELVVYIRSVAANLRFCSNCMRYISDVLDEVLWMAQVPEYEHSQTENEADEDETA